METDKRMEEPISELHAHPSSLLRSPSAKSPHQDGYPFGAGFLPDPGKRGKLPELLRLELPKEIEKSSESRIR